MRNEFRSAKGLLLSKLVNFELIKGFDCGDADINDYFHNDAKAHQSELLSQTYSLVEEKTGAILGLLAFCNDAIPVSGNPKDMYKRIPSGKMLDPTLPSVKITRLGVAKSCHRLQIGTEMLSMVKDFFCTDNRTGCRYVTVDAFRKKRNGEGKDVTGFYLKNGFSFLPDKTLLDTRAMYLDIKPYSCVAVPSVPAPLA